MWTCCFILIAPLAVAAYIIDPNAVLPKSTQNEETAEFWREISRATLEERLARRPNEATAKNVIFFLGDGMGVSSVTGGRFWNGQRKGEAGEESLLTFEQFPYTAFSKTYTVDKMTPDSAGTGTAYLCGVKTNNRVLGVTAAVKYQDCEASLDEANHVKSILAWAQEAGKWTGIVTTDAVLGASPAAGYAHSADRDWYSSVPENCSAKDLAQQLLFGKVGSEFRVILGGGRVHFLPKSPKRPSERMFEGDHLNINKPGVRNDNRNLVEEYLQIQEEANRNAQFVSTRAELEAVDLSQTDRLLGLFSAERMTYALDLQNSAQPDLEPSLEQMTEVAIEMLSKSPKGFVLFVEGGNIDEAHHLNKAPQSLEDVVQFDMAVAKAQEMLDTKDTLIVVTADHSHGFNINGYADRESPVTGFGDSPKNTYKVISYATGPGGDFPSLVSMKKSVHSAEDVPVYAKGPWAHLLVGSIEQSFIPEALAYAACIGPNPRSSCDDESTGSSSPSLTQGRMSTALVISICALLCIAHT